MNYWGVKPSYMERYPQLKLEPIPGYMGNIRSVTAENVIGLSYMNSIKYINDLRKKNRRSQVKIMNLINVKYLFRIISLLMIINEVYDIMIHYYFQIFIFNYRFSYFNNYS